jgi:dTDP-4-dehydrorhamnose reductase
VRVLVLGAAGMLGHRLVEQLVRRGHQVVATTREGHGAVALAPRWLAGAAFDSFAADGTSPGSLLDRHEPGAVINGIGIVKKREATASPLAFIEINAAFPHRLAEACQTRGIRLIHISTDCVFSGRTGRYSEEDLPDPVDLYGHTKLLGEVRGSGCLTLRTSIIGWELRNRHGLLEWFATQRRRKIRGFRNAIYTGLSTAQMSRLVVDVLEHWPRLAGLWHVSSDATSKYDLLVGLRSALRWSDITVEPDAEFCCNRALVSHRFRNETGWKPPTWEEMIRELATEWPEYAETREST